MSLISLQRVYFAGNQLDPIKKASSVMFTSTGSTSSAIWVYHSENTEMQLKLVRQ